MITLNANDSYRLRSSFLSVFVTHDDSVIEFCCGKAERDSVIDALCGKNGEQITNRLLWEFVADGNCRKHSYSEALSLLKNAENLYVFTEAIDNKRTSANAPVFAVSAEELGSLVKIPWYWNFYVFDSTLSWYVIFTDENERSYPEGVCFTNIR